MTALDLPSRPDESGASPFWGLPIDFIPAIIAGMSVGALVLWVVATHRVPGPPDPLLGHLVPWARPMAIADERDQFLYHLGIVLTALGGFAGAWMYRYLLRPPAPWPAKQGDRRYQSARSAGAAGTPAAGRTGRSSDERTRWAYRLVHVLVVVAVASLLYVPDYRAMAGDFLDHERFHHWDFFAIMPTHAYLSGLIPVLESYSQYGVGIPVVVGHLCRLLGDFSHASVVWLGMTYGVLYFIALYALLCAWLQDWRWSVAGLALAILLQQFCGLDPTEVLWQYPSSTILRSPLDVWVFLLLTAHVYRSSRAYLVVAAFVVSMALFWETDTGMYLSAGYLAYCAYCWIDDLGAHGWDRGTACNYIATVAIVPIAFLLLVWSVVGGAILTAVFWNRFFEPLRLFHSGFGMLPMPAPQWDNLHLFLAPGLYVLAGLLALVAALGLTPPWRGGYLLGALGVYGAGIYHQYVGRSHPWNWFHVCIPAVILAIVLSRLILQSVATRLSDRARHEASARIAIRATQLAPLAVLCTAIVLLIDAPSVRNYPGILSGRWFIPGIEWNSPGLGFRTRDARALRDRLEAVAGHIRQAAPAQEPVAILSEFDGILYVMADRRPFSRFFYPAVALDSQVEEVFEALRNPVLRYVFWDRDLDLNDWDSYLPSRLGPQIAQDFELVETVRKFDVWRRRTPAPPS